MKTADIVIAVSIGVSTLLIVVPLYKSFYSSEYESRMRQSYYALRGRAAPSKIYTAIMAFLGAVALSTVLVLIVSNLIGASKELYRMLF